MLYVKNSPQTTQDVGIEAYGLAVKLDRQSKQASLLGGGAVVSFLAAMALQKAAVDAASTIYPDMPDQARLDRLARYQKDLDMLDHVKNDSVPVKGADNHYTLVAVEQQKQDVLQAMTTVKEQPQMMHSPEATLAGGLVYTPLALFVIAAACKLSFPVKKLEKQMKELADLPAASYLRIESDSSVRAIKTAVKYHASVNGLPDFNPPPPKKVLGLF